MRLHVRTAGARFELCDADGPFASSRSTGLLIELGMDLLARADTPYESVVIETGPHPSVVTSQERGMFNVRRSDGKTFTGEPAAARAFLAELPASDSSR